MSFLAAILSRIKGYRLNDASREVKDLSNLDHDAVAERQDAMKWEAARHHAQRNPLYRARVGGRVPDLWTELPIMRKQDFQAPLPEMICEGLREQDLYIANTSGSSGHPFFFAKDKTCHSMTWGVIRNRYQALGLSPGALEARFFGIPMDRRAAYLKEAFKDRLLSRRRFPVFDLSDKVLERFLATIRRTRFDYLYGYTNSLLAFAEFLMARGKILRHVCPTVSLCLVTAEMCRDEDARKLEKSFGVPVRQEYGASEVGIIAIDGLDTRWNLSVENLFVEVVDDEGRPVPNGVEGRILITDLYNRAMPFIRYEVGDLGSLKPLDHYPFRALASLTGRVNDTIHLPSGRKAPGLTFYYVSRSLLETADFIQEFVIRQVKPDRFVFDIVAKRKLAPMELDSIQKMMDIYLEPGLSFEINRMTEIKRPASGKIKHFYSELAGGSN